jgi:hypothetical protein
VAVGLSLAATLGPGLAAPPADRDRARRLGERMYREGILPSGRTLESVVMGDVPSTLTCTSCHLRGGTGSFEGGVITLPTHAAALFQVQYRNLQHPTAAEQQQLELTAIPNRPAYTDATLAIALRYGADPTGREFNPVMPRYRLSDADMAILLGYLHGLSAEPSPGVDAETLRLATVISEEVREEDRQAMLKPLEDFVAFHNRLSGSFTHWMYHSKTGRDMIQEFRRLELSPWLLKGPARTWTKQLEEHYRRQPVFALVGGLSSRDWSPIHAFCERNRIPCVLPLTEFPVISGQDWYTLYFSKGYQQEGQAAARHLHNLPEASGRVLMVTEGTRESAVLAEGFRTQWRELGRRPVREVRLTPARPGELRSLIRGSGPSSVVLWLGPWSFGELARLAAEPGAPAVVLMSSGYLRDRLWDLPEAARASTSLTYPFRLPEEEARYLRSTNVATASTTALGDPGRIASRTHSLIQVLNLGLMEMGSDLYRDNLLDRIGMLPDQKLADYERLSFGPGQRYASKGCYIVQLAPGPSPTLVKKSGWVIH